MSNEEISLTVAPEFSGTRLDAFLAAQIADVSRSTIHKAILGGTCLVNEGLVKPSYKVSERDKIHLDLPASSPLEALPENIPLNIIYEDEEVIVVNKPAGMIVHPGTGVKSGTLANGLVYHFNQLSQAKSLRPGIVHRLDIGTSGLIIVAKTDRAHQSLAAQFEARTIKKHYTALVYGQVKTKGEKIDLPVGRDPHNRVKMAVRPEGQGRNALTFYKTVENFEDFTRLDVQIKTGRTHQIRVHLAHLKYPIVGDATYDSGRIKMVKNPQIRIAIEKMNRPFLHAATLNFIHPNGTPMDFNAPLPAELLTFLEILQNAKKE